jgi:hypothetical protein
VNPCICYAGNIRRRQNKRASEIHVSKRMAALPLRCGMTIAEPVTNRTVQAGRTRGQKVCLRLSGDEVVVWVIRREP